MDLRSKPFYLSDEDIRWVQETLDKMDVDAKIGQLFCMVGLSGDLGALEETLQVIKPGGFMFRPLPGGEVQKCHRYLQEHSDIPLLLAANLERGGNGIVMEGTCYGTQMQVAATDDAEMAYRMGAVCGREGQAVGCNWAFAPVIDLDINCHNPITNTRTFGSDPDKVLRMAEAYMRGISPYGIAVSIKHWPGDGIDSRDQHMLTTINSMSVEEWNETFGKVYKGMIDAGAQTVMAGHIMLPEYSRKLRPGIRDEELMPATLAPELNQKLLREQLGFNGLIVTDSSTMAGFTMAMKRETAIPAAIAAGCDMFLFAKDLSEDVFFMRKGLETGILTPERLDEAVARILALKASLKLHIRRKEGTLVPDEKALEVYHSAEHESWARECADLSVTLVKDTQNLLPLDPAKHKRILLHVLGDVGGYHDDNVGLHGIFIKLLEEQGFQVEKYNTANLDLNAALYRPLREILQYDLVIYFASLKTASNSNVVRIQWAQPAGADVPRFINEVPTLFLSVDNPYHLLDVPRIKTYVNAYTGSKYVLDALVAKLTGRSPFKGVSPSDPFCGQWEARL